MGAEHPGSGAAQPSGDGPALLQSGDAQRDVVTYWLVAASITLYATLSAPALASLGIPYDLPTGPMVAKIHPGGYLMGLAAIAALFALQSPLPGPTRPRGVVLAIAAYLGCMLFDLAWAMSQHGAAGIAFFFDTLLVPGIAALLLLHMSDADRARLLRWMILLLLVNAGIALGEFALQSRLVPLDVGRDDIVPEDVFRSSALLGHPLANALVTITVLPAVLLMPWPPLWKAGALVLLVLALLSFGGRSSVLVGAFVYGLAGAIEVVRRVVAGRLRYRQLMGGLVVICTGLGIVLSAVALTGLGERIYGGLSWDNSAQVRLLAFHTLDFVHGPQWWTGFSVPDIARLAERAGIDLRYEAIENFWVYQLLLLGITGVVPFVLGIAALMWSLLRIARPPVTSAIPLYLLLASSANTLSSKSVSLLALVVAVHGSAVFARDRHDPASAASDEHVLAPAPPGERS